MAKKPYVPSAKEEAAEKKAGLSKAQLAAEDRREAKSGKAAPFKKGR